MTLVEFGNRVALIREQVLKMNQTELASHLDSKQGLVSRFEQGIGGSITFLFDLITFLEKKKYPVHQLFRKEFKVEMMYADCSKVADVNIIDLSYQITTLISTVTQAHAEAVEIEKLLTSRGKSSKLKR